MECRRWQSLATGKPQFDEWHTWTRARGTNLPGGTIGGCRYSSSTASQLRFRGFLDSPASLEQIDGPSYKPGLRCLPGLGGRAPIHFGLKLSLANLRGEVSSHGKVGGQHVQQALPPQTEWQDRDQETLCDDKGEVAGYQVLQAKVRAWTHWSQHQIVQPLREQEILVMRHRPQDAPDVRTPLPQLQLL